VIERLRDAMVGRGEIFPLARLMMSLPEEVLRIAGFVATGRAIIAWEGRANLPRAIALNRPALALLAHDQQGPTRGIAAGNLAECLLDIGDLGAASRAIDEAIEISHTAGHRARSAHPFASWDGCRQPEGNSRRPRRRTSGYCG
jgi:hypothetical protein